MRLLFLRRKYIKIMFYLLEITEITWVFKSLVKVPKSMQQKIIRNT